MHRLRKISFAVLQFTNIKLKLTYHQFKQKKTKMSKILLMLWKSVFYRRKFGGNQRVLPYLVIGGGKKSTRFSPCHAWQRRPPPPPVHRGWTWWWPLDAPTVRMAEGLFYKRVKRKKKKQAAAAYASTASSHFRLRCIWLLKRFGVRWITELKLNIQWGSVLCSRGSSFFQTL